MMLKITNQLGAFALITKEIIQQCNKLFASRESNIRKMGWCRILLKSPFDKTSAPAAKQSKISS